MGIKLVDDRRFSIYRRKAGISLVEARSIDSTAVKQVLSLQSLVESVSTTTKHVESPVGVQKVNSVRHKTCRRPVEAC